MAQLTNIRTEIKNNLANINTLMVYDYVPDSIEPPTAIVGVVQEIDYDQSMQRGVDKYVIPVYLYVSRVDAQDAQSTIDGYLVSSGGGSGTRRRRRNTRRGRGK